MGQKMLLPWMSERRFSCRESAARRRCRRLLTFFVAQARAVASIESEDRKGDGGARVESPVPEIIYKTKEYLLFLASMAYRGRHRARFTPRPDVHSSADGVSKLPPTTEAACSFYFF